MTNLQSTATESASLEIRVGAVAAIDALGFRGIWQRHSATDVVEKLQQLAATTCEEASRLQTAARSHGGNVLEFVRPVFLSDSVLLGVATKPLDVVTQGLKAEGWGGIVEFDGDSLAGEAVRIVAELLGVLIRRGLEDPVPLAYRGAIAFGRFGLADRFVIGEAIDEAVHWMECPHGAFVMLAPSAAKYAQAEKPSTVSNFLRYSVPLKEPKRVPNGVHETLVVSPFAGVDDAGKRTALLDRLTASFDASKCQHPHDVQEKLSNTLRFLEAAEKAEKSLFAGIYRGPMRP